MENKYLKIKDKFYLIEKTIKEKEKETLKKVETPTNFIVVIDVSGSMYYELPQIRSQLKNKLPSLLKEKDTISIVWFSGRKECGILKEEVEVKSLTSLQELNNAIDKWLKPIGLTAFAEPLDLVSGVVQRIRNNRPQSNFAMLFMTDGMNNDSKWSDVVANLNKIKNDIASSTFVEYGHYADSVALTQMAEIMGGEKVTANGFDEYDVVFDNKLNKRLNSTKRIEVILEDSFTHDIVFSIGEDNEINTYSAIIYDEEYDPEVQVWDSVEKLYYFTSSPVGQEVKFENRDQKELAKVLYSAVYVLADRMKTVEVEELYSVLGDKATFELFVNAFGKQKLNDFKKEIKECVGDEKARFRFGHFDNLVLDENAYCVMDLIHDLTESDDNLFYINTPYFNYKRIGAKTVVKDDNKKLPEDFEESVKSCKTLDELVEYTKQLVESSNSLDGLKFVANNPDQGYKLSNLVWNETRANLSVNIKIDGYVNLPKNKFGLEKVDTFIYRTFTIIKDGILNLTELPVSLNPMTLKKLRGKRNLVIFNIDNIEHDETNTFGNPNLGEYLIDFSKLPVINRSMVKDISAYKLAEMEYKLLQLQGDKKVYDYYDKLLFPRISKGFVDTYGRDAEQWLKEIGVTEYSGFNPKTEKIESTDFYNAVLLETKFKGLSALPKVQDVQEKVENDELEKLKANEKLLLNAVKDYLSQINSDLYLNQDTVTQDRILETWLKNVKQRVIDEKRSVMQSIAKIKFSLILSKKWFNEFNSLDENTLMYKVDDDNEIKVTFELKDKQINL